MRSTRYQARAKSAIPLLSPGIKFASVDDFHGFLEPGGRKRNLDKIDVVENQEDKEVKAEMTINENQGLQKTLKTQIGQNHATKKQAIDNNMSGTIETVMGGKLEDTTTTAMNMENETVTLDYKKIKSENIEDHLLPENDDTKITKKKCLTESNISEPKICRKYPNGKVKKPKKINKCNICHMTFATSYSATTHRLIHSGEKPFKCTLCDYATNQNSNLKKHNLKHSGEKPYSCTKCDQTYTDNKNLKKHMKNKHGISSTGGVGQNKRRAKNIKFNDSEFEENESSDDDEEGTSEIINQIGSRTGLRNTISNVKVKYEFKDKDENYESPPSDDSDDDGEGFMTKKSSKKRKCRVPMKRNTRIFIDPEESEYEKIRKTNILEREAMLRTLGIVSEFSTFKQEIVRNDIQPSKKLNIKLDTPPIEPKIKTEIKTETTETIDDKIKVDLKCAAVDIKIWNGRITRSRGRSIGQ